MRYLSINNYISLYLNGCYIKSILAIWLINGIVLTLLYSDGDTDDFKLNFSSTVTTDAYIKNIEETNVSVNGQDIDKYFYSFSVDNNIYFSQCYGPFYLDIDDKVLVEYLPNNPNVSRIVSSDNSTVGLFPIYLFGIASIIFSILLIMHVAKTIKYGSIISRGELIEAKQISKEATNTKINNRRVYKLIYTYEVYGINQELVHKTTEPNKFKNTERVVYNQDAPASGIIFSTLPTNIKRLIHSGKN